MLRFFAILSFTPYTPPSFQMYTPFIWKFHVNIIIHKRHVAFNMLYTYIRTISIFSTTITEYSSVFWHHGEINYSFGRYRIFTRPYFQSYFNPLYFSISLEFPIKPTKTQRIHTFNNISNISRKILLTSYDIFNFLKISKFLEYVRRNKKFKEFARSIIFPIP